MTESFDFITDNIESIKSGKLDDNKVESLCKLILIDYEKTIYDQSYIEDIYINISFHMYIFLRYKVIFCSYYLDNL